MILDALGLLCALGAVTLGAAARPRWPAMAWLTDNTTASLIPSIRPSDNRFAVAWNEDVVEERGALHGVGGRSAVVVSLVRDPASPR